MRRLLVLFSLIVGVQGCSRSGDAPAVSATAEDLVAGGATAVYPPPGGSQTGAAVAWDGTNYLVVWADVRGATGSDVYAARLGPTGALLDASPIVVSAAIGDQLAPEVAFDGTSYLVVWQDHRLPADKNIHAARVSRAGAVLDAGSIAIAQPGNQVNPAVAFDGTSCLVVWEDQRDTVTDIRGARVTPEGAVLDAGMTISAASGLQLQPAVGCAGGVCLAAWRDQRNGGPDVYGARISAAGVLDPAGVAISRASSSQGAPAVACDGAQFLVVWSDTRNAATTAGDVYGARVAPDGAVLDPAGFPVSSAPGVQQGAAVAFEGAYFLATWEDGRSGTGYDVHAARVKPTGELVDPGGFLVEPGTAGARVALASDGRGRALVASDHREVVDPLLGTAVSRVSARVVVSRATLTVARTGSGSGTVTSAPAGIDCGELCAAFFDAPTDVNLTPTAAPGSAFVSWSGACSGSGPCTVTVDDARAVAAKFSLVYPLTITRSGTAGAVVSSPAGIDCGTACTHEFVEDTLVELTPVAGTNSLFKSWSAPCDAAILLYDPLWRESNPRCVVPMSRAWTVTATFGAAYTLTVKPTGTAQGRVEAPAYWQLDCATGATCASIVPVNTPIRLTAVPAEDAILKSWSGCTTSAGLECDVTVSSARTVTATFQPSHYLVTAVAGGTGRGTVTGPGISCATGAQGDCTELVANGGTVTLTAAPDGDSIFKYWTGCSSVSGATCTVSNLAGAKTVTATFQPSHYPLTLNTMGGGGGLVSSDAAGVTCTLVTGVPCTATIANGATVVLTASPDPDSIFKSWSGCNSVAGTACTVSMTGAKTLTVRVEPSTYPLSVAFTGQGRVDGAAGQPPPIACSASTPEACGAVVANGATVTLTATPDPDWILKSWSGCNSASGATCTVSMTGAKSVTAIFQPAAYPLTISSTGGGSGTISRNGEPVCEAGPGLTCSLLVGNGDAVSFTAAPGGDSLFKSWSGCTSASGTTCNVTMTSARTITALLQPSTYLLTAVTAGTAPGTISGAGLACATGSTDGCAAPVANGETVTLTATPGADAILKAWSGCNSVSGATCTVAMTAARTVTATFQPAAYPLTIASSGGGSGTITRNGEPACDAGPGLTCSFTVANGDTVGFTVAPGADSLFKGWSGCNSVSGATCTVTMTGARTITALLQPSTYLLTAVTAGTAPGTITGPGIACATGSTDGCAAPVANGASVTLTAEPGAGAIFKGWSGCTSVSGASCTIAMTMARTATATFQPAAYPLTIAASGGGAGTVSRDGAPVCEVGPGLGCSLSVANGETVSFTAAPGADSLFKAWTGCTTTAGATCNVTMTSARTITAVLQPSAYLLTAVTAGTGSGTIAGGDIACTTGTTAGCTAAVANGATVTLTATAGADSIFKSWSGCNSVAGTACTVTMTSARTATATFQPASYPLTIASTGGGSGTISQGGAVVCETGPGLACSLTVANGDVLAFTAAAGADSVFKSWMGCTSWSGTTCNVTMTSARTITAVLQPSTYPLTVNVSGAGTVSGGAIQCTAGSADGCSAAIANGEAVTLTAAPGDGAIFRGWSGCSAVSGTTCTVTMTSARTVTAFF